jgi:anti-anti-sigma regulatory factor
MLKITCTDSEDRGRVLLRLEGDVRGEWVDELRRACDTAVANGQVGRQLVLDLRDVLFIDARGVLLFQELHARSAEFIHSSAFVAEQLKEVTNGGR